jgi:type IV pilus assembly protein PilE
MLSIPNSRLQKGFTLVELMVTVAVAVILMSVAVPSYQSFVSKQKVSAGQADLLALALSLDGHLLNNTTYPAPVNGTSSLRSALPGWVPVQGADFSYSLTQVDNDAFPPMYALHASGTSTALSGCVITLTSSGTRTKSGCPGGDGAW